MIYDAYLFDLDGTIYLGDTPLPGAVETIAALRAAGRRTIFLSNNPTKSRQQVVARLAEMGIATTLEDVVNSSFVMVQWLLREAPGARLFVVGEAPLQDELRAAGFQLTEQAGEIDFVVASFDRTFDYHKLQVAFDAINAGMATCLVLTGDATRDKLAASALSPTYVVERIDELLRCVVARA